MSGNRNFEGRINPHCRANYLASPPLVVAYALAGRMDFDIVNEPIGNDKPGKPVYLPHDIWPTPQEVETTMRKLRHYRNVPQVEYARTFSLATSTGAPCRFPRAISTPGTTNPRTSRILRISRRCHARPGRSPICTWLHNALAVLGDSITTDHYFRRPGS